MYSAPTTGYDDNPPSDAIVGMWSCEMMSFGEGEIYASLLLNADGTGTARARTQSGAEGYFNRPITWKYEGEGWWAIKFPDAQMPYRVTPQPAGGGKRLMYAIFKNHHAKCVRMD
jgi:hypothetical protein